jgi:hypothetical protein
VHGTFGIVSSERSAIIGGWLSNSGDVFDEQVAGGLLEVAAESDDESGVLVIPEFAEQ